MRSSPHSLLQEFLNRSDQHLWGIVSNGLRLRLLRDNISLTRQAYVEFDLEAMMAGEATRISSCSGCCCTSLALRPSAPSNASLRNGLRRPAPRASACSMACVTG